uniref:Intraflagellar transport protein 56 n=1 Tax=Meloidogyne javanica TaxID=6303 RepID=A0A915M9R1_MELJA
MNLRLWLGYCHFHAANYRNAKNIYEQMLGDKHCPNEVYLYLGCSFFFLGLYENAKKVAEKASKCPLQTRLLFHVAHKINDKKSLVSHHGQLKDTTEDQLCLASVHYLRSHYQQAIDIYKKVLSKNKNFLAINVYMALCYYKLDYYDISMEMLQIYLDKFSDSPIAVNLKACNQYRLYNSKAAENELKALKSMSTSELNFAKDIILHNTVVFRNGDGALQLLPTLVDIVPEARLNLAIYHLKKNDTDAAFVLMKNIEPQSTYEYLLKAITFCIKGIEENSQDLLNAAAGFFRFVGESPAECDTIIGRQSMASAHFLRKQFDEVLVYLDSIRTFFSNDEIFNFNYGQTQLMLDNFVEAEKILKQINGHQTTSTLIYCLCLARAQIANGNGKEAWGVYQKEKHIPNSQMILRLIANDFTINFIFECFSLEDYLTAAKAFDEMEKRENRMNNQQNFNYSKPKCAACIGVVKMFTADKCSLDELREAMRILERDKSSEAKEAIKTINKWAMEVNVYF